MQRGVEGVTCFCDSAYGLVVGRALVAGIAVDTIRFARPRARMPRRASSIAPANGAACARGHCGVNRFVSAARRRPTSITAFRTAAIRFCFSIRRISSRSVISATALRLDMVSSY